MKLECIDIVKSPDNPKRVRLVGKVHYDDALVQPELYWFEVDKSYADYLSFSGNPWLVCLIPLAVTLGEPLRICAPVDHILFENVKELMQIWKSWYPHLHIVPVEVDVVNVASNGEHKKTAAFFSGGIDSFFTVLYHNDSDFNSMVRINDLLSVWGFDIPLKNSDAFFRMREIFQKVASELGKELIDVATNLRETRFNQSDWGYLSHGCALASIAHVLEKRYAKALIASTGGYSNMHPWGSHVLTDPLLSTSRVSLVHDSSPFDRLQKTKFVSKSDIVRKSLHVCYVLGNDKNCCKCTKCYRTMMMLDLYDALNYFTTFNKDNYKIKKIKKNYLQDYWDRDCMYQSRSLALHKGRVDLVKAIDGSFKHTKRLDRYLPYARKIGKWFKHKRFIWRYTDLIERWLLADSIL